MYVSRILGGKNAMKDRMKNKTILCLICLAFLLLLVQACGSKSEEAPSGSALKFTTGDQTLTIAQPTCVLLQILVSYSDGTPMPHALVTVLGSLAGPGTGALYQFYSLPGCDTGGGSPVNSGFQAEADDSGVFTFSALITNPAVTFSDTIYAYSGSAVGTAKLETQ